MPTTCLVGGSGFIGLALTKELLESGRKVVILDHNAPQSDKVEFRHGDYGDEEFASEVLRDVDEVVMLAYASVPKTSFDDPFSDIQSNLPPMLRFFKAVTKANIKKMVIISSGGTVYGQTQVKPITENHPTNPISPYGITKLAVEKYANLYHVLYGMPYTIARPGNAYGPGQQPFTGQGLVATAIASIVQSKDITMFGGSEIMRDYIYIDDLTKALAAVLTDGKQSTVYNIGTGVGTSNQEVVKLLEQEGERRQQHTTIIHKPSRAFDVPINVLDSSRLTGDTGWRAEVAFADGIGLTWDWLEQHLAS